MNKQELIDYCNAIKENKSQIINCIDVNGIIKKIEQLDEPQKVTVPQFVADWIEYCKGEGLTLLGSLDPIDKFGNSLANSFKDDVKVCISWASRNSDVFVRAWLDGYEVEKEKRYEVLLCNGQSLKTVYRQGGDRLDFEKVYGDLERFTRKQLEDAGLGWAFDCQGIEIREVAE